MRPTFRDSENSRILIKNGLAEGQVVRYLEYYVNENILMKGKGKNHYSGKKSHTYICNYMYITHFLHYLNGKRMNRMISNYTYAMLF